MSAEHAGSEKKEVGGQSVHVEHLNTEGLPQLDVIQELDEQLVVAEGEEVISAYTWYLLGVASLSGLLFGYDTGMIGAALVNIGTDIGGALLTNPEKEIVSSATSIGALIGGFIGASLIDRFGRKKILVFGDVSFVIGGTIAATSFSLAQLVVGRIILGLGVGIGAGVCAVYLAELSPTRQRGRVIAVQSIMITGGQLLSYCIGAGLTMHNGWRYLFAISIPPAVIQAICMHWLPESPRYDLIKGNKDLAIKTLHIVYGSASDEIIEKKLHVMQMSVEVSRRYNLANPGFFRRLREMARVPKYRRPVIVSSMLFLACQLGGVNALVYYSATIFAAVGMSNPTAVGILIAATNLFATTVGGLTLDKVGRRMTLLCMIPVAIVSLCLASMSFHFLTLPTGGSLNTVEGTTVVYEQKWVILMIVFMITYLLGFCPALGNIPYTTIELMPLEVRAQGAGIAVGFQWMGNIVIASSFLSIMNAVGPSLAFGIFAIVLVITLIFVILCYPEPAGLSLDETSQLFTEGFGVRKAAALRKAKKEIAHQRKMLDVAV